MKKFTISVLCVTVFCIGLGALVENVGAKFKSDEKALALIKQARLAIGGDQSIADVRSMIIKGNTTNTFKFDGAERTEQGETEIALQLPDKLSKMVRIGRADGTGTELSSRSVDVIVTRKGKDGEIVLGRGEGHGVGVEPGQKHIIIKKSDGTTEELTGADAEVKEIETTDGKRTIVRKIEGPETAEFKSADGKHMTMRVAEHGMRRENELLRLTLSLLLTAPDGMDVSYTYGGETDIDGTTCNLVNADFAGSNIKLYLSKASNLPVMVSYLGHAAPKVMMFKTKAPEGVDATKDVMFERKVGAPEMTEIQVRFSDYRGVNGVQLPFRWTTSTGGKVSEVLDVTNYDINPANIAERFQNEKILVRTKKEPTN